MSHRLVLSHHAHGIVHGEHPIGRFNAWLAVCITRAVGSMWCAYLFAALALVSFKQAFDALLRGDTLTAVAWLAQTFLQLVLLPIIIVGQNVQAAATDERAKTDHEILTRLDELQAQQMAILRRLDRMNTPDG